MLIRLASTVCSPVACGGLIEKSFLEDANGRDVGKCAEHGRVAFDDVTGFDAEKVERADHVLSELEGNAVYGLEADVERVRRERWPAITVEGKVRRAHHHPAPVRVEAWTVLVLEFEQLQ